MRRRFSPELKAEVVRLCAIGDRTALQIAEELGLSLSLVRAWVRRSGVGGRGEGPAEGLPPLSVAERAELEELRVENARLRLDREVLRRALVRRS